MNIKAIDTHMHLNHGSPYDARESELEKADLATMMSLYKGAGVDKFFCSTSASVWHAEPVEEENEYLFKLSHEVDALYQWVVIDPRNEKTFQQADRMLNTDKCVGIKLHPVNHKYTLEEFGDKIFSFAAGHKAIVQIHPETSPDYILPFADRFPEVTFIVAHMGSYGTSDSDAIGKAKYGNVYVDTSGIASSRNLAIEYTVGRVGSERILFGTDTYATGFQRGRIEYALISDTDKENILRKNAERLFKQLHQ